MNTAAATPPDPSPAGVKRREGANPLRGWPQRVMHLLVVLAGWGLFFWGWHEVLGRPWDSRPLWWLILGSLVLLPLLTAAWILHNVGIHRRKGPRTGVRAVDESYRADWNGRPVKAQWGELANARLVVIQIEGEHKVYRPVGRPLPDASDAPAVPHTRRTRSRDDDAPPTAILPEGSTV